MIWSWRTRSNSRTGLGAEFLLPAKSTFSFCCIFYFFLYYRHFFLSFTLSFFFLLRNYVFFDTVLVLVAWFFFPFLLFYLFFLLLSTLGKILAESHHKAPLTTFSIIFSHREILLNRLPNGSKHIRFRYGHRKRAPAQPLEDISSEWNPLPC